MLTILIADNKDKLKDLVAEMISVEHSASFEVTKLDGGLRIIKHDGIKGADTTLEGKIIELENTLFKEKNGVLYKSILDIVEKPIIENILERTDGNQIKAARILGINRNTMRSKIKKLGISIHRWKVN